MYKTSCCKQSESATHVLVTPVIVNPLADNGFKTKVTDTNNDVDCKAHSQIYFEPLNSWTGM